MRAIKPPKASAMAMGIAVALSQLQAGAQQATPPAQINEQKVEKVEVTGSRIASASTEGASPVTVIDAETIKIDGVRSVENLLNNLPQVFADQGGNVSNGSSGTANVNLRGLGVTRTLVLVNGKRLPGGSPRAGVASVAADLNQIPVPLIKRVEILTGGAAAVYGSDAVSGVVNFIMNNRFEGVQIEANQSFFNHQQKNQSGIADVINGRAATNPSQFNVPGDKSADGKVYDTSLLIGANFANGKGNGTVFFSYKKEDAFLQSERDFSACATGSSATGFTCGGSSTAFPGRFFILSTGASRTPTNSSGNTRAFNASLDQYNFAPTNFFQRPSERYGFNASANYDVSPNVNLYSEFSFHDDRTVAQIAPSGLFFGGATFTMHFENPLLSADWKRDMGLLKAGDTSDIFIGRRNVEGGGRQDDIRHTSFRTVVGVKGEFARVWNYDAYMQTAKVIYENAYKNEFSNSRALNALDAVRDSSGNIVCRSVVNGTDPNCVPYNPWIIGGVTPAQLAYIQLPGLQKGNTDLTMAGGSISADLGEYGWKLPSAKSGISVLLGAEQRTEKLELQTDVSFSTGDLAGQGGPRIGVEGKYTVKDVFAELRAPLVEGGALAHQLSLVASLRHSDYSTGKKAETYGLGVEWSPVKSLRARGSVQRAVRAANVQELFAPQGLGLFNMASDPCAGATPTATFAQCQRTGVTAAQYGKILDSPAGQYNALFGGNPNLNPETGDSRTVGIVFEPLRNFSATLDYFDIKVKDAIAGIPSPIALQRCLDVGDFCNLITRDQIGSLWATPQAQIVATSVNVGVLRTTGFDIGFNYQHKLEQYGVLGFNLVGTLLTKVEAEPIPGLGSYDCKGLHGAICGVPSPKWRHKLRASWNSPWNFDLALTWRHLDKVNSQLTSDYEQLRGAVNPIDREMGARDYIDLAASWAIAKNFTFRVGINNLFDKDPPIANQAVLAAVFGNGNTYPVLYDALGRRVFLNAQYRF